jgi:hypothetical protein
MNTCLVLISSSVESAQQSLLTFPLCRKILLQKDIPPADLPKKDVLGGVVEKGIK